MADLDLVLKISHLSKIQPHLYLLMRNRFRQVAGNPEYTQSFCLHRIDCVEKAVAALRDFYSFLGVSYSLLPNSATTYLLIWHPTYPAVLPASYGRTFRKGGII